MVASVRFLPALSVIPLLARLAPEFSVMSRVAVRLSTPVFAFTAAAITMSLLLFTLILPPPVLPIAFRVNVVAVLVRLILPLVMLVALKLPIALAPFSVVPSTEVVCNDPAVIEPKPDSVIGPLPLLFGSLAFKINERVPRLTASVIAIVFEALTVMLELEIVVRSAGESSSVFGVVFKVLPRSTTTPFME